MSVLEYIIYPGISTISLSFWLRLHDILYILTCSLTQDLFELEVWMGIDAEYFYFK